MQTETVKYHHTPTRMGKTPTHMTPAAGEDVQLQELTTGGDAEGTAMQGGSMAVSQKTERTLTIQSNNCTARCWLKWVENLCVHRHLFIAALLIIGPNWEHPRCPL